jgi:NitT/TauT family transport system permease protein
MSTEKAVIHEGVALEPSPVKEPEADPNLRWWTIRGELNRRTYLIIALCSFAIFVTAWWLLSASGWFDRVFLPTPLEVVLRLQAWLQEGTLFQDAWISIFRVTAAFVISALMAVPLALFIGTFKPVQAFFEPLVEFARYLPAVAFVPLVLLWVGIGEGSKITVIWIGTFFQMVLLVSEDVRRVPMAQIEAAQTMGADRREVLSLVVLKSAMPAIVDTLRITLGWAWTYLVVAELVAANSGLGYAVLKAQRFLQTDKIFVGILLIGVIGLAMDQLFRLLHRKTFPWLYHK